MAEKEVKSQEQEVLEIEKPNMDEQSALPKDEVKDEPEDKKEEPKVEEEKSKEEVVAKEEAPEPEDWRAKELRRKHAQIKERDRQLDEKNKEIEDLKVLAVRSPAKDEEKTERAQPNLTQSQIQEAARQLRDQERYQEDLTKINADGEKNYGKEWAKSLENLAQLGTVEMPTMQGILATDDPAKVLYELGKNPGEYQRIMELRPERRQTEFVKLSLKTQPKKVVSSAPEPVETVRGRVSTGAMPQDTDSDEDWYKKWNALQEEKRKKRA